MAPATAAMLRGAGYGAEGLEAFGRALSRVRGGEDEDGAANAEGVDVSDFYALLDAEDAARAAGI